MPTKNQMILAGSMKQVLENSSETILFATDPIRIKFRYLIGFLLTIISKLNNYFWHQIGI